MGRDSGQVSLIPADSRLLAHRDSRSAAFLNGKAAYGVFASGYTHRESALVAGGDSLNTFARRYVRGGLRQMPQNARG